VKVYREVRTKPSERVGATMVIMFEDFKDIVLEHFQNKNKLTKKLAQKNKY